MADQTNALPEAPVQQSIAPNIDAELDAALSKSFKGMAEQPEPPKEEVKTPPKEEKKIQNRNNQESSNQESRNENVKREEKPVEKEKPVLSQEEIEKIDPKDKGAWGAIKNANKRAHSMLEQRESEINKLKAALAEKTSSAQKELEALKAEKSELEKYRAMVDIQADPEFVSKYDQPIENVVADIKSFLKERNVSDEVLNQLDLNNKTLLSQIIGFVDKAEGELSSSELRGKIRDYLDLSSKRKQTLEEQKKNYKETLEKRKQEGFTKGAEAEGRMIKHLELKASEVDKDGRPLIPFLKKMEPKENATQSEIDQVNIHNGLVDAMGKKLQSVLKMKEPEQQAEIAIAAVASHYLMAQINALNKELSRAKEELGKMAAVTNETPVRKSTSVLRNKNDEPADIDNALGTFFSRSR